jgi:hypothetical protein
MSYDIQSPPQLPVPPRRFQLVRANLLSEVGRPRQRLRRPRLVVAIALVAVLVGAGTAVGVRFDFLAELERIDERPWAPPQFRPLAPRVEVARGPDWSFVVWESAGGLCVAQAAGAAANWAIGCGSGAARDEFSSKYLITTLITAMKAEDGRAGIIGFVEPEVSRIEIELGDGRVVTARTREAPPALDTDARLFLIRTPIESAEVAAYASYASYAADGKLLERYEAG